MLVSLLISTIAFFVASHYIKRYLEKMDIPKGMARTLSVFVLARHRGETLRALQPDGDVTQL